MNNIKNPTLVLFFPRSGSSLVTKIFHEHGLWIGENLLSRNKFNKDGYYENKPLKRYFEEKFGRPQEIWRGERYIPRRFTDKQILDIERILKDQNYNGEDWIFKINPVYYRPLLDVFPGAKVVCTRRCKNSSLRSLKNTKFKLPPETYDFIVENMEDAIEQADGITVNYENLIKGNFEEINEALKESNLTPDQNKITNCIKPHYRNY